MRITNSTIDSLSQNGLTMVEENSASDAYIEETNLDNDEIGRNVGINDSTITNEENESDIPTSINNNSIVTTSKPLIQLNLFGEVSVDQGEKKWVKGYTKKDGSIVKGHMKYKNNIRASKKKTKKTKKSKQKTNGKNSLMTSFFDKV